MDSHGLTASKAAKSTFEERESDELREGCEVKPCCVRHERLALKYALDTQAPCPYCEMHCVLFWAGTLYIGCEAIDSSRCRA